MAGEYYKWLARDVQPDEPPRELTPREKWNNWWDYHKWHVIIALVCLWMAGDFVLGIVEGKRNVPDYTIAYVGTFQLPDDTIQALETAFASKGEDLNGNGKVQVRVQQYILSDEESTDIAALEQAAEQEYAVAMQLRANLETAESVLFLLEDPEGFQEEFGLLGEHHRWADCPALTGLDLGSFLLQELMTPVEGSNQGAMAELYFARRIFENNESSPAITGANALFEQLTEGVQ